VTLINQIAQAFEAEGIDPEVIKKTLKALHPSKHNKPSRMDVAEARAHLRYEYFDVMLHMQRGPERTKKLQAISKKLREWK